MDKKLRMASLCVQAGYKAKNGEPIEVPIIQPIRVCEMLATLDGPEYIERVAVNSVANVKKAEKAILKAFQNQVDKKGFSLIEVVSSCPTNWGLTPVEALKWVDEKMIPYYPLGVYKDRSKEEK